MNVPLRHNNEGFGSNRDFFRISEVFGCSGPEPHDLFVIVAVG